MKNISARGSARRLRIVLSVASLLAVGSFLSDAPLNGARNLGVARTAKANSVYFNLASGNLSFSISAATANLITTNDNWSGVASVEGYFGQNLTATHGVDPQTVLGTEFASNQLPNTPTNVAANKGNPSAFNAGGLAEFDTGSFLAVGMQGNVQANPYVVFYVNTTGRSNINFSYTVQDIDSGSNDSVSRLALQYRVGETGLFTNLPAGYVADVTTGGVATAPVTKSVTLPLAAENKPQVQIRLITTNAANSSGASTPDEWIGINSFVVSSAAGPSAASVDVGGRAVTADGAGIRGAYITMWDSTGNARTAITGPFGYYSFENVEAGQTYIFEISSKRFSFANPVIVRTVSDSMADVDFVADGASRAIAPSPRRSGQDSKVFR